MARWIGPQQPNFDGEWKNLKPGDVVRISGESWDFVRHLDNDVVETDGINIHKSRAVAIMRRELTFDGSGIFG